MRISVGKNDAIKYGIVRLLNEKRSDFLKMLNNDLDSDNFKIKSSSTLCSLAIVTSCRGTFKSTISGIIGLGTLRKEHIKLVESSFNIYELHLNFIAKTYVPFKRDFIITKKLFYNLLETIENCKNDRSTLFNDEIKENIDNYLNGFISGLRFRHIRTANATKLFCDNIDNGIFINSIDKLLHIEEVLKQVQKLLNHRRRDIGMKFYVDPYELAKWCIKTQLSQESIFDYLSFRIPNYSWNQAATQLSKQLKA